MLICTSSLKNFSIVRYFLFRLIFINNKPLQHRSILPTVATVVLCCAEMGKHTRSASTKKQQRRQKLHESKQKADSWRMEGRVEILPFHAHLETKLAIRLLPHSRKSRRSHWRNTATNSSFCAAMAFGTFWPTKKSWTSSSIYFFLNPIRETCLKLSHTLLRLLITFFWSEKAATKLLPRMQFVTSRTVLGRKTTFLYSLLTSNGKQKTQRTSKERKIRCLISVSKWIRSYDWKG